MKRSLLYPPEDFQIETFDEVRKRYIGFGKDLFVKIQEQLPEIFGNLKFYKQVRFPVEDSYAEYRDERAAFAIQLEPAGDVIVLWNDNKHFEIGTWSSNEYDQAINCIKFEFLKPDST